MRLVTVAVLRAVRRRAGPCVRVRPDASVPVRPAVLDPIARDQAPDLVELRDAAPSRGRRGRRGGGGGRPRGRPPAGRAARRSPGRTPQAKCSYRLEPLVPGREHRRIEALRVPVGVARQRPDVVRDGHPQAAASRARRRPRRGRGRSRGTSAGPSSAAAGRPRGARGPRRAIPPRARRRPGGRASRLLAPAAVSGAVAAPQRRRPARIDAEDAGEQLRPRGDPALRRRHDQRHVRLDEEPDERRELGVEDARSTRARRATARSAGPGSRRGA